MSNDEGMTKKRSPRITQIDAKKIPEKKVRVNPRHSRASSFSLIRVYSCPLVVKGQCEKEDSANVAKIFDVRGSLAQRRPIDATSPENSGGQIKRWKKLLA